MNILFLLKDLNVGGVEIVTTVLANKFCSEGHHVVIWAFKEIENGVSCRVANGVTIEYGIDYGSSKDNIDRLRECLLRHKISVVIDQWALTYYVTRTLAKASKGLGIKIISVYHNNPESNGRLKGVEMEMDRTNNLIGKCLLRLKYKAFRFITSRSMRYTYQKSNNFIVLSNSFVDCFKRFTGISNPSKLVVITNPVTIDTDNYVYTAENKEKEIIFCGRLDENQKRVSRIIDVWSLLEEKNPEWKLTFVGDGEERNNLEAACKRLELKRVFFEGFASPIPYYKRASILILTSEYEGFPLVLAECMSFGVVPVVYGSYPAVYDIIENEKNGMIIPFSPDGFKADLTAKAMSHVMENVEKKNAMALAAIEKSKNYSVDEIYNIWINNLSNYNEKS